MNIFMKKLVISIVFVFVGFTVFGQQDAQFTQNVFNKLDINPGYAGSTDGKFCFTVLGRQQWSGFEGNPETYLFSGNTKFGVHGVGLTIFSDKLGIEQSLFAKGAYSYNKTIGAGHIGIGVELGMLNKSLGSNFIAVDDPGLDPAIPNENTAATTFDAGFGLYLKMPKFYVGLSAQHIPASTLKAAANGSVTGNIGDLNYDIARHYYVMAGYDWDIQKNQKWVLKPSVFIKTDAASTQMDFNVLMEYNKVVWGGVSYRLEDAIAVLLGVNVKGNVKLGVAYDITTSSIGDYSNGSMELMLRYCFNLVKPPVSIRYTDPRRLPM